MTDLFISHTHIDHFIGFDALLRLNLTEDKTLHVYGPPGICQNVIGKLQGYTWNICQNLRLVIVVHEILPDTILVTTLESWRGFTVTHRLKNGPIQTYCWTLMNFRVTYLELDHKTPSFGYSFLEADSCNVQKDTLEELGLQPGPWVAELKARAFTAEAQDVLLHIGDATYAT